MHTARTVVIGYWSKLQKGTPPKGSDCILAERKEIFTKKIRVKISFCRMIL